MSPCDRDGGSGQNVDLVSWIAACDKVQVALAAVDPLTILRVRNLAL
jgi:hypothetical protein